MKRIQRKSEKRTNYDDKSKAHIAAQICKLQTDATVEIARLRLDWPACSFSFSFEFLVMFIKSFSDSVLPSLDCPCLFSFFCLFCLQTYRSFSSPSSSSSFLLSSFSSSLFLSFNLRQWILLRSWVRKTPYFHCTPSLLFFSLWRQNDMQASIFCTCSPRWPECPEWPEFIRSSSCPEYSSSFPVQADGGSGHP